jgi:hypothetical protein
MNRKDRVTLLLITGKISTARADLEGCLLPSLPGKLTKEDLLKNALKYINQADDLIEKLILKKATNQ